MRKLEPMEEKEQAYFQALKSAVVQELTTRHSAVPQDLSQWRGSDLVLLQEDLARQVQGRISEKWFYTHFKQTHDRLPRIDMLDMLSRYVGHHNWREFQATLEVGEPMKAPGVRSRRLSVSKWAWLLLLLPVGVAWQWSADSEQVGFCFVDELTGAAIADTSLEILWMRTDESPVRLSVDSSGCVAMPVSSGKMTLVVQAPYYRRDTLQRDLSKSEPLQEQVALRSDEYARMIHYFSQNRVEDWQRRRQQLAEVFADEARIFQLQAHDLRGMELYNKQEFIDRLTLPISSLGQIEVLDTEYRADKIIRLTFIQK